GSSASRRGARGWVAPLVRSSARPSAYERRRRTSSASPGVARVWRLRPSRSSRRAEQLFRARRRANRPREARGEADGRRRGRHHQNRVDAADSFEQEAGGELAERNRTPCDDERRAADTRQQAIGHERVAVGRERDVEDRPEDAADSPDRSQRIRALDERAQKRPERQNPERAYHDHLGVHTTLDRRRDERSHDRAAAEERQHYPDRRRRRAETLRADDQREDHGAEGEVRARDEQHTGAQERLA